MPVNGANSRSVYRLNIMKNSRLHTVIREPLLHFLLIGSAIFLVYSLQNEGRPDNNRIVISEAQINHLVTLWEKKRQRLPTQHELESMIEQQIREEVMYREALAMGLDQNDGIIRRRLAQKIEFISADLAALVEPTEAELTRYLLAHSKEFELPARINFVQVYISPDKHGEQAQNYANSLLDKLTQADSEVDVSTIGDPFMLDQHYEQLTEHDVTRLFGKDFASNLFTLPVGNWQGPVQSGYGAHLVRIDNRSESRQQALNAVREKVQAEWMVRQRRDMDKSIYNNLRQRYEIVVEDVIVKDKSGNTVQ